jgi:6-phosphogluconolactonase
MATFDVLDDASAVARSAARIAVENLQVALADHDTATWVLAGGTSPLAAYGAIAQRYSRAIDWGRVSVILGDERCVPKDCPDANWGAIVTALLDHLDIPPDGQLRPEAELGADDAAQRYESMLQLLPVGDRALPRLDHVWLGIGEDGHTLSLFPDRPDALASERLVIPVHDSPKPPQERMSLTLKALKGASTCLVLAAGHSKAEVVARAQAGDLTLPIVHAVRAVESVGGDVIWLVDRAASGG